MATTRRTTETDPELAADAPTEEAPAADMLLDNRRTGVIVAYMSKPKGAPPPGGVQEHETDQLFLLPGLSFMPAAKWASFKASVDDYVARSVLVECGHSLASLRNTAAIDAVHRTGDIPTLRRLLADEERQDVVAAIEKALASAEQGGPALRAATAAHQVRI